MKIKLTIIFLFITFASIAQSEYKTEMIKVKTDKNIDPNKLSIKLSEGTWKVILYPLFENNHIINNAFPKEAGIYRLIINYSDNLFYSETVIYKSNPNLELLEFDFYQENQRMFCKIKSEQIIELNKEIVMNPFDEGIQNIINETKK
jgi:hypothetical protein